MTELSIIQSLSEKYESFLEKTKLSKEHVEVYNEFGKYYNEKRDNEIESIINGSLKLYATEQIADFKDYTEEFEQIRNAFSAFKSICERPKSHLKSINEVRPIETIKRIGYEAIPYLAAHSEDWLARTAGGLKPARLFSRVEEDDFQIYENRVVKTLLDLLISFLRRVERQLRYQKEQLSSILTSSDCQTGSFGFDKNFSIAISKLISDSNTNEKYLEKFYQLEELHKTSYELLKKYRTLRNTKLYQLLKKSNSVQNPLNETNILLMDKKYSIIYKLWQKLHRTLIEKSTKIEDDIEEDSLSCFYQQFVSVLCGFSAYVLNFHIIEDGRYQRDSEHIEIFIEPLKNGIIRVNLIDQEKISVPIKECPDTSSTRFEYNGENLIFPHDITEEETNKFCSQLKTKGVVDKIKDKYKEQQQFLTLKQLIQKAQKRYKDSKKTLKTSFIIIPYFIELSLETISPFYDSVKDIVKEYVDENENNEVIIALPLCNEYEQKVIKYAQDDNSNRSILPITMFDINSFRRIQNVLYRHILKFKKGRCLVCGGELIKDHNQEICFDCNNLTLIKTQCPNSECKKEYDYLTYDGVTKETIKKMQEVHQKDFFQWDSLWQYKNIVPMIVENGKIRPICPYCHHSKE